MKFQEIIPTSTIITKEYDLCDSCLGRLFSKQLHLNSNRLLGKKIKSKLKIKSKNCYICKNLIDNLDKYHHLMLEKSSEFEYSSFVVGAILKPSIVDRDDYIRSKFKLKGIDGIKTEVTRELSKKLERKTKKTIDPHSPDVTFTVNIKDESCNIHSKSILICGKYNKNIRGVTQKQKPCSNCLGKGCGECNFHGIHEFSSIEGIFSRFLFRKLGGTLAKFTWIGGEDKSSLVLGSGRLFFVKLHNPNKRRMRFPKQIKENSIVFHDLKIIPQIPKMPISFHSLIQLDVESENFVDSPKLKKLKEISKSPVVVYEKSGKRSEKRILSLKYKRLSQNNLRLIIDAEGGLPIKRFVNDEEVNPNISQKLGVNCKSKQFDFLEVILNGNK